MFQERIPSTLIKGQWREGTKVSAWKRRGFQRGEEKKRKKKKGENEEGTARYRKFESSHRGSGCCFIMRCTHLLQPPRTSWYLFLVRSLHTAVCVKRTVCSMQSSRDRRIVVCRPSAKIARDYRSKTRQLIRISPYELNRKSFFIRLRPSFHSSMSCLSLSLSFSCAPLLPPSPPPRLVYGTRRLIIAATWSDERGWNSKIRLDQLGFSYFPSVFCFLFIPVLEVGWESRAKKVVVLEPMNYWCLITVWDMFLLEKILGDTTY